MVLTTEKHHENMKKINELSVKLEAEISNHSCEIANFKTALKSKSLKLQEVSEKSDKLQNEIKEKSIKIEVKHLHEWLIANKL